MPEGVSIYTTPSELPPVTACINVFNDVEWLEKCAASLQGKVKAIVVVDGAYEGFPHDKPYSTDGTIELARQFADIVVTKDTAWESETVKRNHYVKYVPKNEWWLRIDADEEFRGNIPPDLQGVCYRIELQRTEDPIGYPIHALFKKGAHSRIYGTHHSVWWYRSLLPKLEDLPVLSGCKLVHHAAERDVERVKQKSAYYRNALRESEREFRQRFNV